VPVPGYARSKQFVAEGGTAAEARSRPGAVGAIAVRRGIDRGIVEQRGDVLRAREVFFGCAVATGHDECDLLHA
jgi:hypothetical protein